MKLLITGGAGFIGSAFLNRFVPAHPAVRFLNLDRLSYAGNLDNLLDMADAPNYAFLPLDLADRPATTQAVHQFRPDVILHLAAESHVDRSIAAPEAFLHTNVLGTFHLLEAARSLQAEGQPVHFVHVSTDEVYGTCEPTASGARPGDAYAPGNPYSASKAAADHLVSAWANTYRLSVAITHCSNNYGPRQFPEKLLPFMLLRLLQGQSLPLYGDGSHRRDWLFVDDHCDGLWAVIQHMRLTNTAPPPVPAIFHFSAQEERPNRELVTRLCECVLQLVADNPRVLHDWPDAYALATHSLEALTQRITSVTDRPGHDRRYCLDSSLARERLAWQPQTDLEEGLRQTVHWYLTHPDWLKRVLSGAYRRTAPGGG